MTSDSGHSDTGHAYSDHDSLCGHAIAHYDHAMHHLSNLLGNAVDHAASSITGNHHGDSGPGSGGAVVESGMNTYSAYQEMQAACPPSSNDNN